MIDIIKLHDALRFSGFAPDVPFHATDSAHEMKLHKLLSELGEDLEALTENEDLDYELQSAKRDLEREEEETTRLEDENRELRRQVRAAEDARAVAT